jgi:enoyl-CoA hydratase
MAEMERTEFETVIYEKDGPVATIILNRPDKANAQNSPMVWDVERCLDDASADYSIKVLVLKANGRGFSSGHAVMDGPMAFPEFAEAAEHGHPWRGQSELFLWPVLRLWEFEKPTMSAVHGYCIGGGTYFALLPDIVIAADDAYFQMPLVQGLGFPGGETMMEPWLFMNYHRAYEYLYTAQTVGAVEAERLGMVNRVVPRADLDAAVDTMAHQIAEAPLSTLMGTKAMVRQAWEQMGLRVHWQNSLRMMELIGKAGDVRDWREENMRRAYPGGPRGIAKARFAEAAERRAELRASNPDATQSRAQQAQQAQQ